MYKNVNTGETRTDEEFMDNEYRDLVFDLCNNDTVFKEWINDNYTAFDIMCMEPEEQEELYIKTWEDSCKETVNIWLRESAHNDFYLGETEGWQKVLDNGPEV